MRKIYFFNTLSREKEEFISLNQGKVKLYSCGPTVYNYAHIGNLRSYVFADLLKRTLLLSGYDVEHVMNITDVDDKTIKNSIEQKMSLKDFTLKYEELFMKDLNDLNIIPAKHYPRATDYINEIIEMIKKMLEEGHAYKTNDGIYFKIASFERYSELAKLENVNLKTGASERVAEDEYDKENPNDFALWKFYSEEDGDVFWDTELGKGRPGWHIECSAMSTKLLGKHIDIHTGGIDLIFPHHTNEIAQSESVCGSCLESNERFVNYWMHNDHLLVEGKKMAKRFNNFYTLNDLIAKGYSPRVVRYVLSSSHYRQQMNFTFESLDRAEREIQRISNLYIRIIEQISKNSFGNATINLEVYEENFMLALSDDLNVAKAITVVNEFMSEANNKLLLLNKETLKKSKLFLEMTNTVFEFIDDEYEQLSVEESQLIVQREELRNNKEYSKADEIRTQLSSKGIELRDTKEGTIYRKKTKND